MVIIIKLWKYTLIAEEFTEHHDMICVLSEYAINRSYLELFYFIFLFSLLEGRWLQIEQEREKDK